MQENLFHMYNAGGKLFQTGIFSVTRLKSYMQFVPPGQKHEHKSIKNRFTQLPDKHSKFIISHY